MTRGIAFRASVLLGIVAAGIVAACEGSTATTSENGGGSPSAAVDDAGDAGDAGFGCCPLLDSPPTCDNMGHYGGSRRVPQDSCDFGPTDAVYDPTVPGWKVTNDDGGCPIWTRPEDAGFVSCQNLDASLD